MARSSLKTPNPLALDLNFTSTTNRDSHVDISPVVNPAPCVGKTVFVTGAASEMGQAIVISFAAAGADRIAIMDRVDASATRTRALQAAVNAGRPAPEMLVLKMDVCDVASVEAGVKEVSSRWGHVDVLINNAGGMSPFEPQPQPLGASDMDTWWRTWEVNVKGVYLVARALLPLLLQGTEKTIVNLTSVGSLALTPGASASQLSKLAVLRLPECLMLDYAHDGLLAYSVHPALELAKGMPEAVSKAVCVDQPELAGDTVVYLTNRRREWLAGRHVSCAWDMRELMARKDEIVQNDLLKLNMSFGKAPARNEMRAAYQGVRGRVPRNSY